LEIEYEGNGEWPLKLAKVMHNKSDGISKWCVCDVHMSYGAFHLDT